MARNRIHKVQATRIPTEGLQNEKFTTQALAVKAKLAACSELRQATINNMTAGQAMEEMACMTDHAQVASFLLSVEPALVEIQFHASMLS